MASVEQITQAGPWALGERLGFNGAVATFKARHASTNQHAVVVALERATLASPPHLAYFKAEFPRLAALPPSALCKPLETGEEATFVWAAFDWLPGRHLGSYVQEYGLPTCGQSLRLMAKLIPAVVALHDAGAVHRLITPASIFLHADGSVRLLHTAWSGLLLGVADGPASPYFISNLPFLAPEIARGEPGDSAADTYSIGANLFFLLCGQPTHWHEDPRVLAHTIGSTPVSLDAVQSYAPPSVQALLAELLETSPDDRPVNLEALAERLKDLAAQIEPMPQPLPGALVPGEAAPKLPSSVGDKPPTEESGDDDTRRLLAMARQTANKRAESSAFVPVGQAMAAHAAAGTPPAPPAPAKDPRTGAVVVPPPPPPAKTAAKGKDFSNASTVSLPRQPEKPAASAGNGPLLIFGGIMAVLLLVLIGALIYILTATDKPADSAANNRSTGTPAVQPGKPNVKPPRDPAATPGPTPTPRPSPTPTKQQIEYADTVERLKRLGAANRKHFKDFGTWARRTREIKSVGAEDADLVDVWGTEFDLRDKGFVVSAGPDKKWDTSDDLWIEAAAGDLGGWKP